jgi:hypothetical protein
MPNPQALASALQSYDGPTMRAYEPSWRDRLASALMGDSRATPERSNFVSGLVGSRGLGSTGNSVADFTPAGAVLQGQEAARSGDAKGVALAAIGALPGVGVGRKAAQVAEDELMLALHNTDARKLGMIEKLGGLPVPSMAITKPEQGFRSFGDISLVGGPEFATPSRGNPVFASDVYSPRFPSLNDDQTKIFRGFNNNGNRMYRPLNLENVVKEMKGGIRGGEGYNYGAGSVRSAVTPQFRSFNSVQNARGKIVSDAEFDPLKEQANERLFALADEFHPYSKYGGSSFQHATNFAETLQDIGKGKFSAWGQDYEDLPPELKAKAHEYLGSLRDMPTEYFEAKPQRGVSLNEFQGAVVPHDAPVEAKDTLRSMGVPKIVEYDREAPGSQQEAFRTFRNSMFSLAPLAAAGAFDDNMHSVLSDYGLLPARNQGQEAPGL